MELFHEYKNKYFHLVLKILNLAGDGLEKDEILKIIEDEDYNEKPITKDFKTFEGMILNEYDEGNLNLLKRRGEKYYSALNNDSTPVKVRLSNIEKTWLKGLITDEKVQMLLGTGMVDKLKNSLKDVNEGSNKVIEFTNKSVSEFEEDMERISRIIFIIIDAINNERLIKYTNVDRSGNEYKDKLAVPIRIEYSLKDDRFRASFYSLEDRRAILVNLHTLKEICIEEESFPIKREKIIDEIKENKFCEEPVTIVLKDIRGAMERCFMSFSSYERSSKLIEEDIYEVDIYYYMFEEKEVISKIVFLGPYVKVKGPEKIKNMVIEKIKNSYEYQCIK